MNYFISKYIIKISVCMLSVKNSFLVSKIIHNYQFLIDFM